MSESPRASVGRQLKNVRIWCCIRDGPLCWAPVDGRVSPDQASSNRWIQVRIRLKSIRTPWVTVLLEGDERAQA